MKTILLLISLAVAHLAAAQTQYQKAMGEAFSLWKTGNTEEAMHKMEIIASVEKDNWIPQYYQALIATTASFQSPDKDKKNALIKIAATLIPIEKSNAEWHILKATLLTAELTLDPMNNAMRLTPEIIAYYEKALQLEPYNPRAIAGLAEFQIRRKKFMGGNTEQEYIALQKALSLFDSQKSDIPFYPTWGKEQAESLLNVKNKK